MTPAEAADARTALAEAKYDVAPLHPYTVTVARGVTEHAAHVDDLIASHLQGWTLERLPAVDRAILRVAVWELLHADDVPAPVAVDEAVELAKELSTDDSPGFVNGVLGQVMLVTPQIRAAAQAVSSGTRPGAVMTRLELRAADRRHPGGDGGAGRGDVRGLRAGGDRGGAGDLCARCRRVAVSLDRASGRWPAASRRCARPPRRSGRCFR